jgi:hypothetical protein
MDGRRRRRAVLWYLVHAPQASLEKGVFELCHATLLNSQVEVLHAVPGCVYIVIEYIEYALSAYRLRNSSVHAREKTRTSDSRIWHVTPVSHW